MTNTGQDLRALVAKWRARTIARGDYAGATEDCADELEAALTAAQGDGPQADHRQEGGEWNARIAGYMQGAKDYTNGELDQLELRATAEGDAIHAGLQPPHPAPPAPVTDAMTRWAQIAREGTPSDWQQESVSLRKYFAALSPAAPVTDAEVKMTDSLDKIGARITRKDGIGACDALYELAVESGASEIKAAGFAHVINGAFSLLEGQVHDALRTTALSPAAQRDGWEAFGRSNTLYSFLTDAQNGIDSPATCSIANSLIRRIDRLTAANGAQDA